MTGITRNQLSNYIQNRQFTELFNEMGWNYRHDTIHKKIKEATFHLSIIAEKSGFVIMECAPNQSGAIPDYATRKKLSTELSKLHYEHLIIYTDSSNSTQVWQLIIKEAGKPIQNRETRWYSNQAPELLYQRLNGVFFTMEEEGRLTIVDVRNRMLENFAANADRLTRRFYDSFKKEHTAFLDFINGIEDLVSREWYTSLMLNRLMFCYFIQKKGYLDSDIHYLRNKLREVRARKGRNKFYSFYRNFLLTLFHVGLGSPETEHTPQIKEELGRVPYLNGGLFDVHKLEQNNPEIQIADEAFERIFDFFDQWEWHLDVRPDAPGDEINPDVIGYIFEKYINDRAQMGAYYTREDITGYISKNCIIPFLFDKTAGKHPDAFKDDAWLWTLLSQDPDRYIFDALKKGVDLDLPSEIAVGLDTDEPNLLERRKSWNRPAPEEYALPTEIWREVVERRSRHFTVREKLVNGEIKTINDFITYNLNIIQFIQDVLENTEDYVLIRKFYQTLTEMTVLDPTCGSGAFLFAAMNILEPLYEACIQRMENFVLEGKGSKKYDDFAQTIEEIRSPAHPSLKYFIYKSIILNNLYGVDIMNEAVEIAKLRLFLKLIACVEPDYSKENLGLEPLPDIDFNIRCGNTLVGFATKEELNDVFKYTLDGKYEQEKIEESMEIVADAFKRFKQIQLEYGEDFKEFKEAKNELDKKLTTLNNRLNIFMADKYGVKTKDKKAFNTWLLSHKPFHWLAEFYSIIKENGGFDVIIGNPPYVEYSKVRNIYEIINYKTKDTGNLYAYVTEKALNLIDKKGFLGMIIPLTAISNNNMKLLRDYLLTDGEIYISSYEIRPSKLFDGVDQRLTIFIKNNLRKNIFSTGIQRWYSDERPFLFNNLYYVNSLVIDRVLRFSSSIEWSVWQKFNSHVPIKSYLLPHTNSNSISYRTAGARYWIIFLNKPFQTQSLSNKTSYFQKKYNAQIICATLNSNLFWWWYSINYDMFNIKDYMIFSFRFNYIDSDELIKLSLILENHLEKNKHVSITTSKTRGRVHTYIYEKKQSKFIMDQIDHVLSQHYGFTAEELDYIINYDVKYRMGLKLGY